MISLFDDKLKARWTKETGEPGKLSWSPRNYDTPGRYAVRRCESIIVVISHKVSHCMFEIVQEPVTHP
ncbi:hypothetical protein KIN20_031471 [Parelaphostrongylus tenuis]|uniref:Uncharacterized protein n=1 Tax=Parelaphostrongylus tenuis TaxID=148309 RepID=A0AAD5R5L7_PARTN|nr:hypothetical protein KIN20_031471 [Parelaphostrongylus tenuis]